MPCDARLDAWARLSYTPHRSIQANCRHLASLDLNPRTSWPRPSWTQCSSASLLPIPGCPRGSLCRAMPPCRSSCRTEIVPDRAVCAITHGGMGFAQKALARGVPVCVVPHGRDQFEVARRVKVARCGTRLPAKKVNPRTIEVEGARGYVDDRRCKANCRRLQDHWRCEPWRRRDRASITRPISLKDQPRCLQSPVGNSVPAEPLPSLQRVRFAPPTLRSDGLNTSQ